jgi:hypothetical protein
MEPLTPFGSVLFLAWIAAITTWPLLAVFEDDGGLQSF